jgi:dihydroorotase
MTLYLTDNTVPDEIDKAAAGDCVFAVKYYPAGATTNSDSGVTDIANCYGVLEKLAEHGIPLLVHGEVTAPEIDIFDREKVFIDQVLAPLVQRFPTLKIVLEHITTADAVDFVAGASDNVGATITVHHLHFNRNHMLVGGIKPHYYCLPILKRNSHQQALREAAVSGNPRFFLGTDSAPHLRSAKETSCGCAGCYTAPAALELYAEFFEQMQALDKLEGFASHFGADFYGLPRNQDSVRLEKSPWPMAAEIEMAGQPLVPLRAADTINWKISS